MKAYFKILTDDTRFAKMLSLELADMGVLPMKDTILFAKDDLLYILADLNVVSAEELTGYAEIGRLIGFSGFADQKTDAKAKLCASFLHRPFHMDDLRSLIDGNLDRLSQSKPLRQKQMQTHLIADPQTKSALFGDMRIALSDHEYKVLSLLCEKRGTAVSREELHALLGTEKGNMGDVYICHLRRKIDNKLGLKLILTVRGKGYMLKE